jgi:transketolase
MTQTTPPLAELAKALRFLAVDMVEQANSGHPGLPLGAADIVTVLFSQFIKINPAQPDWPDRDRFVLSAGHGSALLYALNHLLGYKKMTLEELKRFRQLGSLTPGHPEHDLGLGIETTTGPLGQGLATAVGMAIAESALRAEFGPELVDHRTYVLASDGDMMEGLSHEAAALAGHLALNKLVVLYDDNGICIDGPTSLSFSDNTLQRFESYGWAIARVDGHNHAEISAALTTAQNSAKPTLIACKTTIGYGAPSKAGTSGVHGSPLGKDEMAALRSALNWPHDAFDTPAPLQAAWQQLGQQYNATYSAWQNRLAHSPMAVAFTTRLHGSVPAEAAAALDKLCTTLDRSKAVATRQASGMVIDALAPVLPALIGGSADLTPSNNTRAKLQQTFTPQSPEGRYIHWGVREHGMAAALNGIALHGGFIPYAGTFLCFADYARPALRLAALMHTRAIHIMTHDSIGLGEDGPTHQPVEHLASLRAIPNLLTMRPSDVVETAACWHMALQHNGPSVLALSRQNLPQLATAAQYNDICKGGYVLHEAEGAQVTLMTTGSEVSLAVEVQTALQQEGIRARVVSLPCLELFDAQDQTYKAQVLGPDSTLKVAIEAAIDQGWHKYIGRNGIFCGMTGFGASAPAGDLYRHFGLTAQAICQKIKAVL